MVIRSEPRAVATGSSIHPQIHSKPVAFVASEDYDFLNEMTTSPPKVLMKGSK
jgi:hypothetical protein